MLLEHFSIWVASLGVELYLAPARFAVWILLALVAGILGSWACLKIGSLWNLAYRRGVSTYILATLCGLGLFVFVLTSTAISYVNSLVTQALRQRPERVIALSAGTRQTCLGLSAALPYLNRQMGSNFSLDCEVPESLDRLRAELGARIDEAHRWIAWRLQRTQLITALGLLIVLLFGLGLPSWQAYRGLSISIPRG